MTKVFVETMKYCATMNGVYPNRKSATASLTVPMVRMSSIVLINIKVCLHPTTTKIFKTNKIESIRETFLIASFSIPASFNVLKLTKIKSKIDFDFIKQLINTRNRTWTAERSHESEAISDMIHTILVLIALLYSLFLDYACHFLSTKLISKF